MTRVITFASLVIVCLAPASPRLAGAIASEPGLAAPKLAAATASEPGLAPPKLAAATASEPGLAPPKLAGTRTSEGGHEHFRIVGTITKLAATEMDVKNKEGKTYTVDLNKKTIVKRDKEKAELGLSVLKVGMSVVVDAYGDDEFDLEALDVRIVPPIGKGR